MTDYEELWFDLKRQVEELSVIDWETAEARAVFSDVAFSMNVMEGRSDA